MSEPTVRRLDHGPLLRATDLVLRAVERLAGRRAALDAGAILDDARRATGLDDFGDPAFEERLGALLAEVRESPLTAVGRASTRAALVRAMANRLRVQEYVRRHPEVERVPVERPIFVLGAPRTGTTVLQHLLELDEGHRALRFWELFLPVPVHRDPVRDRRIRRRKAQFAVDVATIFAPEMHAIHHISADTAEECWPLFYNSVAAFNLDLASGFHRFGDRLLAADMTGPYREYRRQLQVLAHWRPTRRFVLKCPEHLWFLDALTEVFPDACIVWTHRSPVDTVPSYASLVSLNHRVLYGRVDAAALGAHIAERFRQAGERAMAVRARVGEDRFFDVDFRELVEDPARVVRAIKERFGLPHDDESERRVAAWLARRRPDARGRHRYTAEQWGIDPARLQREFAAYIERFLPGIALPVR